MNSHDVDATYLNKMYQSMAELLFGPEEAKPAEATSSDEKQAPAKSDGAATTSYSTLEAKGSLFAATGAVSANGFSDSAGDYLGYATFAGAFALAAFLVRGFLSMFGSDSDDAGGATAAEKRASSYRDPFSSMDCYGDKVY